MEMPTEPLKPKLIYGKWEDNVPSIKDESINLIYTDPPYEMNYLSQIPGCRKWNKSGKSASKFDAPIKGDGDEDYVIDWEKFIDEMYRVLKPNSFFFVHHNMNFWAKHGQTFAKRFTYRGTVIWNKKFGIGGNLDACMKRDWEPISYLSKGSPKFNPIKVERPDEDCSKCPQCQGEKKILVERKRISEISDWTFQLIKKEKVGHPTQKPLDLARQIILLASKEGDTVLDPFAGSAPGTIVSMQEKRLSIAMEFDPRWTPILRKRVANEVKRLSSVAEEVFVHDSRGEASEA